MFLKYGKPQNVEDKALIKSFSKNFAEKHSINLLDSHLQILLSKKSCFVGSKALSFAIKFTSNSTKNPVTMEKLKPFVETILYEVVIPTLFITERDITTL